MPTIVAHVSLSRALPRAFASWAIPPFLGPAVRHISLLRPRLVVGAESPRAVPTFLLPVLRSRSAALSAGLERVHGQSAVGPLAPRACPVLGRRCRATSAARRSHLRR